MGGGASKQVYSRPGSSEPVDCDDPDFSPSLAKHLQATHPTNLFQRRHSAYESMGEGLGFANVASAEDDGGLTGRSMLSMPDLSMKSRSPKATKLHISTKNMIRGQLSLLWNLSMVGFAPVETG